MHGRGRRSRRRPRRNDAQRQLRPMPPSSSAGYRPDPPVVLRADQPPATVEARVTGRSLRWRHASRPWPRPARNQGLTGVDQGCGPSQPAAGCGDSAIPASRFATHRIPSSHRCIAGCRPRPRTTAGDRPPRQSIKPTSAPLPRDTSHRLLIDGCGVSFVENVDGSVLVSHGGWAAVVDYLRAGSTSSSKTALFQVVGLDSCA